MYDTDSTVLAGAVPLACDTQSHLVVLLLFSGLSATALAVVYRPAGRRLRFGARVFAAFTLGTFAAAWLMAWLGR